MGKRDPPGCDGGSGSRRERTETEKKKKEKWDRLKKKHELVEQETEGNSEHGERTERA